MLEQTVQTAQFFIFIRKRGPHWNQVSWGPPESRSKDADVPRAPFKQCCEAAAGFNIAELMWTCCLPTHLNIAKLWSKGSTRQKPKTSAKEKERDNHMSDIGATKKRTAATHQPQATE